MLCALMQRGLLAITVWPSSISMYHQGEDDIMHTLALKRRQNILLIDLYILSKVLSYSLVTNSHQNAHIICFADAVKCLEIPGVLFFWTEL